MVSESVRDTLIKYKSEILTISAQKNLKEFERNTLQKFYLLIEKALLNKIDERRYDADTIIKARTLEFGIILSASNNSGIRNLVNKLNLGII